MARRLPQVFLHEREEHGVLPLAVPQIRLAPHAFADVAGPFGVRDRPLVEAVDLQLDAMEAELEQEMTLEEPRRRLAEAAAAEARRHGEAAGLGDPAPLVHAVEADHPRTLAVHVDDEPPERVRLALRALDLGEHVVARLRDAAAEERPRLL